MLIDLADTHVVGAQPASISLSLRLRADASGLRLLLVERKFVQSDLGGLLACADLKIIDFHWIS